ncbi:flagellar filament capping protein FliD [Candidatus Magnetominusculus xianensis]|uniref:Flagellar hook-associated protein 2 n=1 Tax=Candidatus Magnetominusculus xianensis TaxID=1748249 RepID=A0ABR5SFC0_9BACT|nr:flagellar filament capping protein FliD [Candidatus Magnetominusculus xianensis]KWT84074.1 flagellar hook protein FliD [Candidatus Magnetominusculus xianensis]MBF0402367.1 flagellar filament capping protein FliD [Nitrospirota bacterium]
MADTTTTSAAASSSASMTPVALSTGPYSGLNTDTIINAIMMIDQLPYNNLVKKAASYSNEISAFGQISSSLAALKTAVAGLTSTNISTLTATSSNQNVMTATASTKASPGSYEIKVNQLAQEEKVISYAYATDTGVTFKTGTLTVGNAGHTTDIAIDRTNNTLTGIRDAINKSATDVSASIINDGTGYRLIISTKNGGAINGLQVTGSSDGPVGEELSDLSYAGSNTSTMTLLQTGSDASFTVDGLTITSHSNTVANVLKGVTLNLQSATSPTRVMLNIGQNSPSSSTGMTAFVKAYNDVLTQLDKVSAKGEPLNTNSTVTMIRNALRTMTTKYFNNATSMLAQYGVNHLKDGTLQIDTAAMDKALSYNRTGFNKLLDAFSYQFNSASAYGMLGSLISNTIANVTGNLKTNISRIQVQEADMQRQLDQKKAAYQKKFARLEATIAQLQTQGSSIRSTSSGSTTGTTTNLTT